MHVEFYIFVPYEPHTSAVRHIYKLYLEFFLQLRLPLKPSSKLLLQGMQTPTQSE